MSAVAQMPALRFPEFEGAWEERRLGAFFEEFKEKSVTQDQHEVLTSARSGLVRQKDYYDNDRITDRDNVGFNIIPPDFLTYRSRSDDRKFFFNENKLGITGIISVYYPVFRIVDGNNNFFSELLAKHSNHIGKYSVGTSQTVLSMSELKRIKLPVPGANEQKKIAAFLGVVDAKITALQERQARLERYKRGLMQALFSQTLRFTKDDGTAFPDWEEKRLDDIAEINPKPSNLPVEFRYIDIESVKAGALGETKKIKSSLAPSRAQRSLVKGDILYQTVRPYQRNNLLFSEEGTFVASTGYAQIRAHEDVSFLFQALHTDAFVNAVLERCTGTSYPAINSRDLATISLPFPRVEEQRKISGFLAAMDEKVSRLGKQILLTAEFKKGLIQQMFV